MLNRFFLKPGTMCTSFAGGRRSIGVNLTSDAGLSRPPASLKTLSDAMPVPMKGSCLISNPLQFDTRGTASQLDDALASATAVGTSPRRTLSLRSSSFALHRGSADCYFLRQGDQLSISPLFFSIFLIFCSNFFGVLLEFFCTLIWQSGEALGGEIVVIIGCNVA